MINRFAARFRLLTGNAPFPWQGALFAELVADRVPAACNIPTGLGKTSVIAVWLLALAERAERDGVGAFPRRLAYVVNRRTVVDQATAEAEAYRRALIECPDLRTVADSLRRLALPDSATPLAISTLRGQYADNAEWRSDPSRPAVVVGTVDMIGSRLLFSGYGCGFKTKPLHAGFLGQDTILVHDEAHLEPAFQSLVVSIAAEQGRSRASEPLADPRPLRVMALTATPRDGAEALSLSAADHANATVRERIHAKKVLRFHSVASEREVADEVTRLAESHMESGQAILVFLRKPDDVQRVADCLQRSKAHVQKLTGTLRGLERDALAKSDPIFARFMPMPSVAVAEGTAFLVCTSAGEVGVNISADHLVCDLTPFDSMAQRFGRVNRFGHGDARVDLVHAPFPEGVEPYPLACSRTLALLQSLPSRRGGNDVSPAALGELPAPSRQSAFSPQPQILPLTDILLDTWSLTSIRDKLPGRPPVADWLHGVAEWEPPRTTVAWREEVELLPAEVLARLNVEDLLDDFPLKAHEFLSDDRRRVASHLLLLADRHPDLPAWIVDQQGNISQRTLATLLDRDRHGKPELDSLGGATVLLPPRAGGLDKGQLNASSESAADVASEMRTPEGSLVRLRSRTIDPPSPPDGMRLVRTIELPAAEADDDAPCSLWHWYVRPRSADDDGSRSAKAPQELEPHLRSAADFASALVAAGRLGLTAREALALVVGTRGHDLGKKRAVWQRAIRNREYPAVVLAKSGGRMTVTALEAYRHEFGSLVDVKGVEEFRTLDSEAQDLVLHVIAAHHGRARPHFPLGEAFDPEGPDGESATVAREVPLRFARLQRRYGRWGLAYFESVLRAADALASQVIPERGTR